MATVCGPNTGLHLFPFLELREMIVVACKQSKGGKKVLGGWSMTGITSPLIKWQSQHWAFLPKFDPSPCSQGFSSKDAGYILVKRSAKFLVQKEH